MRVTHAGWLAAFLLAAAPARAEPPDAFPARQVRLVVPFSAGGTADIVARVVAERLRAAWSQPVVVDNVPGAGGNIGGAAVARAEPDGYTLLASPPGPIAINRSLYRGLPYDAAAWAPITVMAHVPNVFDVGAAVPARTVAEFTAAARAAPDRFSYASQGAGSTSHLTAELFLSLTGARLVHIPYRGTTPALTDLMAGRVELMFDNLTSSLPQHADGRLRILAVLDDHRSPALPDVPTTAEAGLPALRSVTWFALVAPAGTPLPIRERINAAVAAALRDPALRARLLEQGAEPGGESVAATAAFITDEARRWAAIITAAHVTVD